LAVPRAWGPVFMFCAPRLVFGDIEVFGSRFHVLRARTSFRPYRGCRFPFSYFARPDSFSKVPRASSPVFMFCPPELDFSVNEGVGSRFHVLRSRTRFRRYGQRRITFSCFAHPDSFSVVSRASGPILMFKRSQTCFRLYRRHRVPFSCFARSDSFSAVPRASGHVFMF
jgi:hypothetical protein